MTQPGRNDPCPCGSGKKYKHCHLGKPDDRWKPHGTVLSVDPYYDPYTDTYFGGDPYSGHDPNLDDAIIAPGAVAIPPDGSKAPIFIDPGLLDRYTGLDDDFDGEVDGEEGVFELTPIDEAWDLIGLAWDEPDPGKRKKLAKSALKISRDCAGAYFHLGLLEKKAPKRIELLGQAYEAACKALEPDTLTIVTPSDWDDFNIYTAVYALFYRAMSWLALGESEKSINDLDTILSIDPFDSLQASSLKLLIQIDIGDDAGAEQTAMLERSLQSARPVTLFGLALARFRLAGDTFFARRALSDAIFTFPDLVNSLRGEDDPLFESITDVLASDLDAMEAEFEDYDELDDWDDEFESDSVFSSAVDLLSITFHLNLWNVTEGASEWLRQVYDAGPRIRYDNGNLGDGPMLRLATDLQRHFRNCPICHRKTESQNLDLVLEFSNHAVADLELKARRCNHCNLISVDFHDLQRHIVIRYPGWVVLEFLPLGYIPSAHKSARPSAPQESWLREHMEPFRKIDDGDWDRTEWPSLADQQDSLLRILEEAGISDLVGSQEQTGLDLLRLLRP